MLPCEVSSHDAATNSYEVALTNGHTGKSVTAPRVQLMFDGEDQQTFVDRFTAALAARDAAVQDLQYKLCIKDMPTAKKGEVSLPLDKIDRVLQWTFNTDALKINSERIGLLRGRRRGRADTRATTLPEDPHSPGLPSRW